MVELLLVHLIILNNSREVLNERLLGKIYYIILWSSESD